jgi:chemotaxis protein MotB
MSKKHKKKHSEEEGGEAWLLPYSDLMTLLLAVFIVLFAVSQIDEATAKKMAESFSESMMSNGAGVMPNNGDAIIDEFPNETETETQQDNNTVENDTEKDASQENTSASQEETSASQAEIEEFLGQYELANLEELKSELDVIFQNDAMTADITTKIDTRGLVISLSNSILFESGSADIKTKNEETLKKIAETINALDNYIRIEGHTDSIPVTSGSYPSNWELSTARATCVVRLFIDECNVSPEKLVAVGYGEYRPIADNTTNEGRAKNRRIDIIVLSEKYNNLEE